MESNHIANRQAFRASHLPIPSSKARHMPLPLAHVQFSVAPLSQTHARRKPIYDTVPCDRAAIDNTTATTATWMKPTLSNDPTETNGEGSSSSPRLPTRHKQKKFRQPAAPRVYVVSAYIPRICVLRHISHRIELQKIIKKQGIPLTFPSSLHGNRCTPQVEAHRQAILLKWVYRALSPCL